MANIKSAIKRIDVIKRKTMENRMVKSQITTYIRKVEILVKDGNIEEAKKLVTEAVAYIDSASTKGVIHRNNAARKVSRITRLVNTATVA